MFDASRLGCLLGSDTRDDYACYVAYVEYADSPLELNRLLDPYWIRVARLNTSMYGFHASISCVYDSNVCRLLFKGGF